MKDYNREMRACCTVPPVHARAGGRRRDRTAPREALRGFTLALAVVLAGAVAAGAQDFGANINIGSSIHEQRPAFRSVVSGWFRLDPRIDDNPTLRLLAEASVTNITRLHVDGEWTSAILLDIDSFRADGILPGFPTPETVSRARLGRFRLAEPSGLVFSNRLDGLRLSAEMPAIDIVAGGGYTGLIATHNSAIAMTMSDRLDDADGEVVFGSPRIVATAHLGFPELFDRQTLTVGGLAQWDMRNEDDADRLDSQYAFLRLDGPIAPGLYYDSAAGVSFQQPTGTPDDDPIIGLTARGRLEYYMGPQDMSLITVRARYGSGPGDVFGEFVPVTAPDLGVLRGFDAGDLLAATLNYDIRPFVASPSRAARNLQFSAYGSGAFRADPTAGDGFRGVEVGTRVTARLLSDFGARLWLAGFLPGEEDSDPEVLGRLELSASF